MLFVCPVLGRLLSFVLINSVPLNLSCFWFLFQNASSHSLFQIFVVVVDRVQRVVYVYVLM